MLTLENIMYVLYMYDYLLLSNILCAYPPKRSYNSRLYHHDFVNKANKTELKGYEAKTPCVLYS